MSFDILLPCQPSTSTKSTALRSLPARGGVVRVRVVGDRVKLGGQAVTVLQGHLLAG